MNFPSSDTMAFISCSFVVFPPYWDNHSLRYGKLLFICLFLFVIKTHSLIKGSDTVKTYSAIKASDIKASVMVQTHSAIKGSDMVKSNSLIKGSDTLKTLTN